MSFKQNCTNVKITAGPLKNLRLDVLDSRNRQLRLNWSSQSDEFSFIQCVSVLKFYELFDV